MLPIIFILAIATILIFIVDEWLKFRDRPEEKAKRKKREEKRLLKGTSPVTTERLHGKQA